MALDKGKINSDTYEVPLEEYTETGKLDFDFLLGRHLMHVNNLLSQDLLGDTITGQSLSIQKCEVGLDVLSNMIEVYTPGKDVLKVIKLMFGDKLQHTKLDVDDETKLTYYAAYKEVRTEKYKRYCKSLLSAKKTPQQTEVSKLEFRYSQLSVIHRYLMLWINECGLTPSTTSVIETI